MEENVKSFVLDHLNDTLTETPTLESKLRDDLSQDSLERVEMGMTLEKNFNIDIPDEEIAKWNTVQDVVNTVIRLVKS